MNHCGLWYIILHSISMLTFTVSTLSNTSREGTSGVSNPLQLSFLSYLLLFGRHGDDNSGQWRFNFMYDWFSCLKSLSSGGVNWWAGLVGWVAWWWPVHSKQVPCRIPAWKVYEMWGVKLWER